MGWIVSLEKSDPKYGLQKAGPKKQGHCYSKRGEAYAFISLGRENSDGTQ